MTETSSNHAVAFGAPAYEPRARSPDSWSTTSASSTIQSLKDISLKRSSWRKLRQSKRLRLPDFALKFQHGSASLVELAPAANSSPQCRVFEVPAWNQVPSLKSTPDTTSLSSNSAASEKTYSARRQGLDSSRGPSGAESPYFHVRSASEDSYRSGSSDYSGPDRLAISASTKTGAPADASAEGIINLHGLSQPLNLVLRPKSYFDPHSRANDTDTVTTASSRTSMVSTSRTSWTMSPPLSPMFGDALIEHITSASIAKLESLDASRPVSMISDNTDFSQPNRQDESEVTSDMDRPRSVAWEPPVPITDGTGSCTGSGVRFETECRPEIKAESLCDEGIASWEDISRNADYREEQKLDKLWDFAIEQFPSLELANSLPILRRRSYARHFVSQIAETIPDIVMQESDSTMTEPCDGAEQKSSPPGNQGRRQSGSSPRQGKRKSHDDEEDDDLDDNLGDNNGDDDGPGPSKRRTRNARTEPADTYDFMCPFRLKDPKRFNVRDHKCALKVFRCNMARKEIGINELRRHIKDDHLLEGLERDPRNQCDRCKTFFKTQSDKEGHVKTGRCEYREHPTSRDPLEGIDIATRDRLISKKGRQGQHPLEQYHGLCKIIFGDDTEVLPHGHKLVREHFELHALYNEHRPKLLSKFQALLRLGPHGMESLSQILQDHSEGLFESCTNGTPYEVSDVAPLAGKGTPSERTPSPDCKDSPRVMPIGTYQQHTHMTTDSGIGMSNDGRSCESLVKCSEEVQGLDVPLPGFSGIHNVNTELYRSNALPPDHVDGVVSYDSLQLGASNVVDPGFRDTLEHRHHVNPSFLQYTDGRPWLRVKDKDNGKTLRYPIRAPVPVQISSMSTVESLAGPPVGQSDLVGNSWTADFAPDLPQLINNFDSFYGTDNVSDEFVDQHVAYPAYPQAAHHHAGQIPMNSFGDKSFFHTSQTGAHGVFPLAHLQHDYIDPANVYTTNPNSTGPVYQGQHTFI